MTTTSSTAAATVPLSLEKELENVTMELEKLKNNNSCPTKIETELQLLEKRCLILIKLKKWADAVDDSYKILGRHGPSTTVYRCLLVGLLRLNKFEETSEALGTWRKSKGKDFGKDLQFVEVKERVDSYLNAIRSGVSSEDLVINLEANFNIDFEWKMRKNLPMGNWKFRPPPTKQITYHMCSRVTDNGKCLYGNECSAAHSKEELAEWIKRQEIFKQINHIGVKPNLMDFNNTEMLKGYGNVNMTCPNITTSNKQQYVVPKIDTDQPYIPFGIYFLDQLNKRIEMTKDLNALFKDELPDIKFACSKPLKESRCLRNSWTMIIGSKYALRAVGLVSNDQRNNFYISSALYFSHNKESLDLMEHHDYNRNPKLQVLKAFIHHETLKKFGGGVWPKTLYYKIEISFEANAYGDFKQSIVFDFDKLDLYLIKQIWIERGDFPKPIFDCETGGLIQMNENAENVVPFDGKEVTKYNYRAYMVDLIQNEKKFCEDELKKYNMICNLNVSNSYMIGEFDVNGQEIEKEAPGGRLFTKIQFKYSPTNDIYKCNFIYLTTDQCTYMCPIFEKMSKTFIILLGMKMVSDLQLADGSNLNNIGVQFILDTSQFNQMNRSLSNYPFMADFIFPDLQMPIPKINGPILSNLQFRALKLIMEPANTPPILILGPFQTGKSLTIAETIKKLAKLNKKILICTHSNLAADLYITEFLVPWTLNGIVKPLRLYDINFPMQNIPEIVKPFCLKGSDPNFARTPTLEEILYKYNIIVSTYSTCAQLTGLGLGRDYFTHIFLDEAHQVLELNILSSLNFAGPNTKVVLAGDCMQLSREMKHRKVPSLLERLNMAYPPTHPCKIVFYENFGTNKTILEFSSVLYGMKIICSSNQPRHPEYYPLTFINKDGIELCSDISGSFYNAAEVCEIGNRVVSLISNWPADWSSLQNDRSIIVLSAYTEQVIRIRLHLKSRGIDWIKVERVQDAIGEHYKIVIISTVRTNVDSEFFSNLKLITTAFSRARNLIMIVGSAKALTSYGDCKPLWTKFLSIAIANKSAFGFEKTDDSNETVALAEEILADMEKPINVIQKPKPITPNPNVLGMSGVPPLNLSFLPQVKTQEQQIIQQQQTKLLQQQQPNQVISNSNRVRVHTPPDENLLFNGLLNQSAAAANANQISNNNVGRSTPKGLFDLEFELNGISSAPEENHVGVKGGPIVGPPKTNSNFISDDNNEDNKPYSHQSLFETNDLDDCYILSKTPTMANSSPPLQLQQALPFRAAIVSDVNNVEAAASASAEAAAKFTYYLEKQFESQQYLIGKLSLSENGSGTGNSSSLSTSKSNSIEDLTRDKTDFPSLLDTFTPKKTGNLIGMGIGGTNLNGGILSNGKHNQTWTKVKKKKKHSESGSLCGNESSSGVSGGSNNSNEGGLTTEQKIEHMVLMGFEKKSAIKALSFCDKSLEKSIDYLISRTHKKNNL